MPYTYDYPRPALTVDAVLIRRLGPVPETLLVQRANPPFQHQWAFPGGFVEMDETTDQAVARELEEETGLSDLSLQQLRVFSAVDRDPRERVVSVAYWAELRSAAAQPRPASDAQDARWFPIDALPPLAFDHAEMLRHALMALPPASP